MQVNVAKNSTDQYREINAKKMLDEAKQLNNQASAMKDRAKVQEEKAKALMNDANSTLQNLTMKKWSGISAEFGHNSINEANKNIATSSETKNVIRDYKSMLTSQASTASIAQSNHSAQSVLHLIR